MRAGGAPSSRTVQPMFAPYRLRDLALANRIVVSPMATYSAIDGTPNDFHLVHYGARAQGGAGLVFTEMTCVAADARITPGRSEEHTSQLQSPLRNPYAVFRLQK